MKLVFVIVVFVLGIMLAMTCNGQQRTNGVSYVFLDRTDTTYGTLSAYSWAIGCYKVEGVYIKKITPARPEKPNRKLIGYYRISGAKIVLDRRLTYVFTPGEIVKEKGYEWQQK